ncbi:MAG: HAD family hydrolase [Candidatus Hodarchaeota archaeon]
MLKAILFDLYLTLIDLSEARPEYLHKAAWKTLHNLGHSSDYGMFVEVIGRVYQKWRKYRVENLVEVNPRLLWFEILTKMKIKANPYIVEEIVQERHRVFKERISLYDDVEDSLKLLKKHYRYLVIVSNSSDGFFARDDIRYLGLDQHIDLIVTSADLDSRKPDPKIFTHTLEILDVGPKQSVFVGDDLAADIGGAKNVGMYAIYLNRKNEEIDSDIRPDAQIPNLSQLQEALSDIERRDQTRGMKRERI